MATALSLSPETRPDGTLKQVRLHPKHRKFVEEYLKTGSAKRAALNAGYSTISASSIGCQLLNLPKIKRAIEARFQKVDITVERTLHEIAIRAYGNVEDLLAFDEHGVPRYDLANATRDQLALVADVRVDETGGSGDGERVAVRRVTIKPVDQLKALELLAKHQHLLDQRVEIDVGDNLAARMQAARTRTIEGTIEYAQQQVEQHSVAPRLAECYDDSFDNIDEQLVTDELTSAQRGYDDSFDGATQPIEPAAETSTSLPPGGWGEGGIDHIKNLKIDEVRDAGIIDLPKQFDNDGSDY